MMLLPSRKTTVVLTVVLVTILGLCQQTESAKAKSPCGRVLDGLTNGRFDLDFQQSQNTLGANWFGFPDVLHYEWAVFTTSRLSIHFSSDEEVNCAAELKLMPDVKKWENVGKESSAFDQSLRLTVGETYKVALRVTYRSGRQSFSLSNGVTIVPADPSILSSSSSSSASPSRDAEMLVSRETRGEERSGAKAEREMFGVDGENCPIDNANRCRQSKESVADLLTERYGPARFIDPAVFFIDPLAGLESSSSTTPDDDDGPWIAGIVIGSLFLLALLLLLLALLALLVLAPKRNDEEEKEYKPPKEKKKERDQNYGDLGPMGGDLSEKDYGGRAGVAVGDASSNYRIEFPDTQIRRLSLTHQDAPDLSGVEDSRSPRRKHPIINSTSSSFRDYRSVGNN
eukprot:TRINITY_DN335_c1_g1_i1.p1 TRINITY_DN335_c1_g1~~TRINITY_DN335_c1_g1_i1.p1  ORF type:complete len:399 (-),score=186.88 TRINITY_DN335_c1_g1_i1:254-1450(-)